jgi:hypothetical protein
LFVAGVKPLRPEIADVTGFAELRIDHGNIRVSKFGINCADNGRLQPTRHRNIVGVYSPAAACKLAIQVENMARACRRRQDTPKAGIRCEGITVSRTEPNS